VTKLSERGTYRKYREGKKRETLCGSDKTSKGVMEAKKKARLERERGAPEGKNLQN